MENNPVLLIASEETIGSRGTAKSSNNMTKKNRDLKDDQEKRSVSKNYKKVKSRDPDMRESERERCVDTERVGEREPWLVVE